MSEEKVGQSEQTFIQNGFGVVTNKRVTYFRNKGWFSGGSREDIPLKHVTSVRVDTSRSILSGIFLLLVGFGLLSSGHGAAILFGVVLLPLSVLLIWGSPAVVVNTAGQDLNAMKGFPWDRPHALRFVEVLRTQLFNG